MMLRGSAMYCDDLRVEITGKLLLIGAYGLEMVINGEYPFVIPQLVVYVRARINISSAGKKFKISIYYPNGPDTQKLEEEIDLPPRPTDDFLSKIPRSYPGAPVFVNFASPFTISNISVVNQSIIRTEIECDGVSENLEILRIGTRPIEQPPGFLP